MRRRQALAVIITACATPALGQPDTPPGPLAEADPLPENLPAPAEAPPTPAMLGAGAGPAHPSGAAAPIASPFALPLGMQNLANGGWRVQLARDARDIPAGLQPSLQEIARGLAATSGRVTIIAQAPAPALEASFARRLSLERGLAMKAILVAGGLAATRIDIRPMGRQANGADVVDILPPGAAR